MSNKDAMAANLQPHPSLPARPPPSTTYSAPPVKHNNNTGARGYGANPTAYGGFTPRSVVAQAPVQASAAPVMYSQATVSTPYQPTAYPTSNTYYNNSYQAYGTSTPTAAYPAATNMMNRGYQGTYDPEEEARIAEWNSAYTKDDANAKKGSQATTAVRTETANTPDAETGTANEGKRKTVVRQGGGKSWEDSSLLEWDPMHPRLFIGNLAGEVTDDSLLKAFSKYPSVSKARVVRDKRTTKSKSYGFVSFANTDDYFRAAKEMQGKYIGSHPVLIKRANTEVKATTKKENNHGKHGNHGRKNNNNQNQSAVGGNAAFLPGAAPFRSGVQKKGKNSGPRVLG